MKRIITLSLLVIYSLINFGQIIADHTVVDKYDKIPQQYIDKVKKMWLVIAGESHSRGYGYGLLALESSYPKYAVNYISYDGTPSAYTDANLRISHLTWGDVGNTTGWQYYYGEEDWFTSSGAIAQTKTGITYCNSNSLTISAIGFGWCWDPGYTDMTDYLSATQAYIDYCITNSYATKVFFTTGPVDGTAYLKYLAYEAIRSYVNNNSSRILFDYADILCYDDNGSLTTAVSWDGHTYPTIAPTNLTPVVGEYHISVAGTVRLAKAMWWMLARIAGWDGDIYSGYIWQGGLSSNFGNPDNWIEGVVPPDGANISFEVNPQNPCLLDKNRILKNITNPQGIDMLVVNGHQLTISGNLIFSNGGQIDATATGSTIVFTGSDAQSVPSGSFLNNNVSSLIVANPAGLSLNGDLTVPQILTINVGSQLYIGPTNRLTIPGTLNNNGILNLNSDATGIFSLMMNNYSGTGTANINMYLTGGAGGAQGTGFRWHYVAVPANLSDKSVFTSINSENLLCYSDSRIHEGESNYSGWQWHDGYNEVTQVINPSDAFFDLETGRGYNFYHSSTSAVAIFSNLSSLINSLGTITLQYSGAGKAIPSNYGLNLLGNSLTCGIDWNLVIEETGDPDDAIYYTKAKYMTKIYNIG